MKRGFHERGAVKRDSVKGGAMKDSPQVGQQVGSSHPT